MENIMTDFSKIKALFDIKECIGYEKKDLQPWFDQFGQLPAVLVDYYVELGAHLGLNQTQDYLVVPTGDKSSFHHISKHYDDDFLIFYGENQRCCVWGIRSKDLGQDNPPVYRSSDSDEEVEWFQETNSLLEFFNSMAMLQAAFSFEFSNEEPWNITHTDVDFIKENFQSKNADSELWTGIQAYGNDDSSVIVVMKNHDDYILFFASRDEEKYEEMFEQLEMLGKDSE